MSERTVRGLYFEDFEVGMTLHTPARTITATDIVNFACLTGDFNEVHANHEYARSTPFGEVIAHGPLIYGVAGGLQYASGINDGTLLALLGIDKWRISMPVKTDGGLLSHAQAGAGGGIFGIVEATRQLRGDQGDRQVKRHDVALVHNEGGILSSNCTMLLGRERR